MDAEFAFERRTTALQRTDDVGGDTVGTPVITITAPNDWNQKEERAALGNAEAEFAAAFGDDASDLVLHDRIGLGQHDARHKRQVVTDRVGFCEQTVARYQRRDRREQGEQTEEHDARGGGQKGGLPRPG
jgi:hypothetical protein